MRLSKKEYEDTLATLATRVETNGIKLSVDELRERIEAISKRDLDDGKIYTGMLLSHEERIKKLEEIRMRK